MPASALRAATRAAPEGGRALRSMRHADREFLHTAQDHRIHPLQPLRRRLDAAPALEHRRQRDLPFEARERKAEADVRAIAEGEVRYAVAPEVQPVGLLVRARIA